jgi:hypothetical protein
MFGRSSGFFSRRRKTNVVNRVEYAPESGFGFLVTILLPNASKLSPRNGQLKEDKLYITTPNAQISALKSYGYCSTRSGARYNGVPTLVACILEVSVMMREAPRSPSLRWLFFVTMMFMHFISRCIIERECRACIADVSSNVKVQSSSSLSRLTSNFFLFMIYCKSPPSAYSITIQR